MDRDFAYELYRLLHGAKISLTAKQRAFEAACWSSDSWPVLAITEAAIRAVHATRDGSGVQRGHRLKRISRAKVMFGGEIMSKDEVLDYFTKHDSTTLITKRENRPKALDQWSKLEPVPQGLFLNGGFSVKIGPKELHWIDEQWQQLGTAPASHHGA